MNTFEDENNDTETIGVGAHDWRATPTEMNRWYSQGMLTATPISGDATTLEKAGL